MRFMGAFLAFTFAISLVAAASPAAPASVTVEAAYPLAELIAPMIRASAKPVEFLVDGVPYDAFESASSPAVARLLKESFEILYSTPTVQRTLLTSSLDPSSFAFDWESSSMRAARMRNGLGVPTEVTDRLLGRQDAGHDLTQFAESMGTYLVHPKHYIFLFARTRASAKWLDSFTQDDNLTMIFVDPERTTRFELLKVLTHEIGISGDMKALMPHFMYGVNMNYVSDEKATALVPEAMYKGQLNTLFEVVRALNFERVVLQELIPLKDLLASLDPAERAMYKINLDRESECRAFVESNANSLVRSGYLQPVVLDQVATLWKTAPRIEVGRTKVSTCQFMVKPYVREHGVHTTGPRPRIGDWNGRIGPNVTAAGATLAGAPIVEPNLPVRPMPSIDLKKAMDQMKLPDPLVHSAAPNNGGPIEPLIRTQMNELFGNSLDGFGRSRK